MRVPVVSSRSGDASDRRRQRVIAPPTESRRWPETPGSVRQSPPGQILFADRFVEASGVGRFVGADRFGLERPASAGSLVPTASVEATGVGRFVGGDRFGLTQRVWHPALFELALYVMIVSTIVIVIARWSR